MSKPLAMELTLAFRELQAKMLETNKKIQAIDSQIGVLERVNQRISITQREIAALSPETKTYESVGRMFLLTDLNEVKDNLKSREAQYTSRSAELEKNKQYLEKNLEESSNNIREMIQQLKAEDEVKSN